MTWQIRGAAFPPPVGQPFAGRDGVVNRARPGWAWSGRFHARSLPIRGGKEAKTVLKRLLFETRLGELLLALLERKAGLAVVSADSLAGQVSGKPVATDPA